MVVRSPHSDNRADDGPQGGYGIHRSTVPWQKGICEQQREAAKARDRRQMRAPTVSSKRLREGGISFPINSWEWVLSYWGKKYVKKWTWIARSLVERKREKLYYYRKEKESVKPTGPGAEGGLRAGALDKGAAVQGEQRKALEAQHDQTIKTNRVPLAPSGAHRCSHQPD